MDCDPVFQGSESGLVGDTNATLGDGDLLPSVDNLDQFGKFVFHIGAYPHEGDDSCQVCGSGMLHGVGSSSPSGAHVATPFSIQASHFSTELLCRAQCAEGWHTSFDSEGGGGPPRRFAGCGAPPALAAQLRLKGCRAQDCPPLPATCSGTKHSAPPCARGPAAHTRPPSSRPQSDQSGRGR